MLIRLAQLQDASALPIVEKSAAELFNADAGLAWLANGPVIAQEEHERLILKQTVWVAQVASADLVGFLNAEVFEDELHVWELSVHKAWQRGGISKKLVQAASRYALERGLRGLTLTTFVDVPWCAPAYSKLGFQPIQRPSQRLQKNLDAESSHGLPMDRRVAMQRCVGVPFA